MGFQFCRRSQVFGAPARVITIVAAAMLGMALAATNSSAGDLTAQPADGLEVTNSSTKLLPQEQAAESSWLSGLHVSGYASQTFGMWQNPVGAAGLDEEPQYAGRVADPPASRRKLPPQREQFVLCPRVVRL